jgi:hypothetical protein
MRHRKLLATMSVGALAVVGGFAAGPPEDAGPPDHAQSDNACEGLEEAQDRVGEDNPAYEVLEDVRAMLDANDCEESASEKKGGNGEDRRPNGGDE